MAERDADMHDDGDAEVPVEIVEPAAHTAQMVRIAPTELPSLRLRPAYDPDALPRPFDPRLVLIAEPNGARAATFRVLRDMLVGKGLPQVAAVSSASPGGAR